MVINGQEIALRIFEQLKPRVTKLQNQRNITPHLAVIRIGDDPATTSYIYQKEKAAESIGVKVTVFPHTETVTQQELLSKLQELDSSEEFHGIILQLPIPQQMDQDKLLLTIDPRKDVDGFHPQTHFFVPVAQAVLEILREIHFRKDPAEEVPFLTWLGTRSIAIMGKGKTGGEPINILLQKMGMHTILLDSQTQNPDTITKDADIVISAVGKRHIITKDTIKPEVILIGVGMQKGDDNKFYGDYDEEEIQNIASFYTPVPGGVGPVNVAKLMENVIRAAEHTLQIH